MHSGCSQKKGECKMEEGEYFTLGCNSGSVFDLKPDVDLLVEFPPCASFLSQSKHMQISWTINALEIARSMWSLFILVCSVNDCPGGNLPHACWERLCGGRSHYRPAAGLSNKHNTKKINDTKWEHVDRHSVFVHKCTVYEKILNMYVCVCVFGEARKSKGVRRK